MNLIDAIKSGKRFRRKEWKINDWVSQDREDLPLRITRGDAVADDWEVEPQAVPITLEQFWDAYNKARKTIDHPNSPNLICDFMAKELGL